MSVNRPIRRALISVSDKTGIVEFAEALNGLGVELMSSGGTASLLRQANLPVMDVSDYTGFNEMMDGRVKTLHPKIHGGILGRRGIDDEIMQSNAINPIDLVIVNLYPFAETIANPNYSFADAIENIDIGGPTLIRSAAKNFKDVTVVVDHNDYSFVLNEIQNNNGVSKNSRFHLSIKAFEHTAAYDSMIANHFGCFFVENDACQSSEHNDTQNPVTLFPRTLNLQLIKKQSLRYGENNHQHAAFYVDRNFKDNAISTAKQLQGKPLSFNNIADGDAALECVKQFDAPACVIVKHANPCGVAIGTSLLDAYSKAYQTDPASAFGGIIAFNRIIDEQTCQTIIQQQFVEVIIVPDATPEAQVLLKTKPNIRLLVTGELNNTATQWDFKRVTGGLLLQESDHVLLDPTQLTVVSQRQPSPQELADALFSWNVVKFVKSNAIVYAKDLMTLGIGAGQTSRVDSTKIAQLKAQAKNLSIEGATMASDAFFPFRDSIDHAGKAGIRCIIQPGGSVKDAEVIQAANEHDIAMIFTHIRHFRH